MYKDKVHFYVVYVRERHPLEDYAREFKHVAQHKTLAERRQVAREFAEKVELSIPLLVDAMDNRVNKAYRGEPDRLYVIAPDGTVEYQGDYGPFGFKPDDVREVLEDEYGPLEGATN